MKIELVEGLTHKASVAVSDENTAIAMKSGSLPVFATPSMVALMEQAASELLEECLEEGETSVGTLVEVKHLAATPLGRTVTATAKVELVSGRKVEFTIIAHDGVNEIGTGRHERVMIDIEKFMNKVGR